MTKSRSNKIETEGKPRISRPHRRDITSFHLNSPSVTHQRWHCSLQPNERYSSFVFEQGSNWLRSMVRTTLPSSIWHLLSPSPNRSGCNWQPYQFGANPGPSLHHPKEPWLDQNNVVDKTILAPWCNHLKKTIRRPPGDQPNQPPRRVRLVPLENYNHDRTMVKPSENHGITEQRRF